MTLKSGVGEGSGVAVAVGSGVKVGGTGENVGTAVELAWFAWVWAMAV